MTGVQLRHRSQQLRRFRCDHIANANSAAGDHLGHTECGIYAEVIVGGTIGVGDAIATEARPLL